MTQIPQSQNQSAECFYFYNLAQGQFLIPECDTCNRMHFYPRIICPHCGSDRLHWTSPSGKAKVYSVTVVRSKGGDYTVCLIDLEEGPRMMSRVVDVAPDSVKIGMAVRARIDQVDGKPLLVFIPGHKVQQ